MIHWPIQPKRMFDRLVVMTQSPIVWLRVTPVCILKSMDVYGRLKRMDSYENGAYKVDKLIVM